MNCGRIRSNLNPEIDGISRWARPMEWDLAPGISSSALYTKVLYQIRNKPQNWYGSGQKIEIGGSRPPGGGGRVRFAHCQALVQMLFRKRSRDSDDFLRISFIACSSVISSIVSSSWLK